ncbi:MAG: beta-galactosidase [Solirubrobacteraceae bacterium]
MSAMAAGGSGPSVSTGKRAFTRRTLLLGAGAGAVFAAGPTPGWSAAALERLERRRPDQRWTLGGELQYFRSDPAHLEQRLARCAEAGYTTIQSYVAWNVHESTRGRIDFTGRTRPVIVNDHADQYEIETPDDQAAHGGNQSEVVANTDLKGFLRSLAARGFRVLLRPGPFISDEWRNGGLPDWLLEEGYPDMYIRGPDGTPLTPGAPFDTPPGSILLGGGPLYYFPSPSYASELYLKEARRWLTAFAAFVRPWLATNGGPVVGIQVDDETCFFYRFGPFEADYHPSMVARYRAQTGQDPPTAYPAPGAGPAALRPAFAWQRFKGQQIANYLGRLAADLRSAGVRVPIFHEQELQLSPPAGFSQTGRKLDALNPEFYNGDSGPWSIPLNELDAAAVRAAQRNRRRLIAVEMQNSDQLLYTMLFGEGLSGGLQFTYTDGVQEDGFTEMARLGKTIRAAGRRLSETRRRVDTAIVWCPDQLFAPYDSQRYGFDRDVRGVGERDVPALATALIRAGLAFDLLDTTVAEARDYLAYPTIWLAAGDILPRSAQQHLVEYVERGGRLICWPAPPTLDEQLRPCTVLAERLFGEPKAAFHAADDQEIHALGVKVRVFRGVQTFSLSGGAEAFAWSKSKPCGYRHSRGRGTAWLLGTWPAADSVPGRAANVFELQQVSSSSPSATAAAARELARARLGARAAAAVPADIRRQGTGSPQYLVVYDDPNDRRGGEVITGGTVAYWDGHDIVPVTQLNSAEQPMSQGSVPEGASVKVPPYRPLTPALLTLVRRLHGRRAVVESDDARAQVRVLDAAGGRAATLPVLNRFPEDIHTVIRTRVGGRRVRLPSRGTMKLPAATSLLLPVDYGLGSGVAIRQATVQLLSYQVHAGAASLELYSPAGGELVLTVPGPVASAHLGSRPIRPEQTRPDVDGSVQARMLLPPGEHKVTVRWRRGRRARRRQG